MTAPAENPVAPVKKQEYVRTFNRFELKYLLHHSQARELFSRIGPQIESDANAGRDGWYKISSLYYDSPGLRCYWEKIDGEKFRRKVRVRTYGEVPDAAFVEIKQRYNLSVQKRRCRYPFAEAQDYMRRIEDGSYEGGADEVLDEVFVLTQTQRLEPKIVISYQRAAFFDLYRRDLRITLDRNLRCRSLSKELDRHRTRGRHFLPITHMVLEVKFNESMPRWLCTALNAQDLQIQRISKYCLGIEAMGMEA